MDDVRNGWTPGASPPAPRPRPDTLIYSWRNPACADCARRQALNDKMITQHEKDLQLVTNSLLKVIARQEALIEHLTKQGGDARGRFALVPRTRRPEGEMP